MGLGSRRKCQRVRHLEKPIQILIALDAGADLKYQPFRISPPREVRVRPKIMLGRPVHRFHLALAGGFAMAMLVSVKQVAGAIVLATMLEAGFFTPPARAATPPRVVRTSFNEPGQSSRGQEHRADRLHPGRPKSPLSSTESMPCIVRSSAGSRSKTGGSGRFARAIRDCSSPVVIVPTWKKRSGPGWPV